MAGLYSSRFCKTTAIYKTTRSPLLYLPIPTFHSDCSLIRRRRRMADAEKCDAQQSQTEAEPLPRRRKIIVAVDESDESIRALTWALDNQIVFPRDGQISDTVVLLHVQTQPQVFIDPDGPGFFITPEIMQAVAKHQEEISKHVLLRAKKICEERNVRTETTVACGDPRDAICDAVDKIHADFLVVGSHGYGAIKRAFLGSVSDYCAHNAKCPVVIVKKTLGQCSV